MIDSDLRQIIELVDERLVRFTRDIAARIPGGIGIDVAECGCFRDQGCCGDKSCCGDKGCCKDHKSRPEDYISDPAWGELVGLSDRLGVSVDEIIRRIENLDPKLLGAKG